MTKIIMFIVFGLMLAQSAFAEVHINMDKIAVIESSGDTMAYNKSSQARGLYQITPICLLDFNQANGTYYRAVELFDPQINTRIAYWYLNERLPALLRRSGPVTVNRVLAAYNMGPGASNTKPWPKETRDYIRKYHKGEGVSIYDYCQ